MTLRARLGELSHRTPDRLDAPFPRGDAAVLLLIVHHEAGPPGLVLTRRNAELRTDPGYVAFPGGRIDPGETAEDAARRECEEEVGITADDITLHGRLDETWNGAGFRIVPIVASTDGPVELRPREAEVSAADVVPLSRVLDDGVHAELDVDIEGYLFRDDVIEFAHATQKWRLYGPTADLARDLAVWLRHGDRRQRDRRQRELSHFAAARGWHPPPEG